MQPRICPRCHQGQLLPGDTPNSVVCSACGIRGTLGPATGTASAPAAAPSPAPTPIAAPADTAPATPAATAPAPRRTSRPLRSAPAQEIAPEPSGPLPLILLGSGVLALVVGVTLLVLGPFDGATVARLDARAKDLRQEIAGLETRISTDRTAMTAAKAAIADLTDQHATTKGRLDRMDTMREQLIADHQRDLAQRSSERETLKAQAAQITTQVQRATVPAQAEMIKQASQATVVIRTDVGAGSGFIFTPEGRVVTNYHVIQLSSTIEVALMTADGDRVTLAPVDVVAVDPAMDLAILQLPKAPSEISAEGRYPTLAIDTGGTGAGQPVFVIGSPGFGEDLLEYTVTKGIVSNNRRLVNGVHLIQTTAAINPGNSGGPMLNERGQAIGVVTLKGRGVEAVGFAVSAQVLQAMIHGRLPSTALVPNGLAAWEPSGAPMDALARKQMAFRPEIEIPFDLPLSDMLQVDDALLMIQGEGGRIQRVSTRSNTIDSSVDLGGILTGACLDDQDSGLYVVAPAIQTIYRLNARTLRVEAQSQIEHLPGSLVYLGGKERFLIAYDDENPQRVPMLISGVSLGRERADSFNFGLVANLVHADGDGRYMFMVCRTDTVTQLDVLPRAQMSSILDKITDSLALQPTTVAAQQQLEQARQSLYDSYDKIAVRVRMSTQALTLQGTYIPVVHSVGRSDMLFGRRIYRMKGTALTELGALAANPDGDLFLQAIGDNAIAMALIDTIFAVSPDGHFAASGLHIYDLQRRVPVKRLPAVSSQVAFSRNNRDCYIFDHSRNSLLVVKDWQRTLPNLE